MLMDYMQTMKHYATTLLTAGEIDLLAEHDVPLYGPNGLRRYLAERSLEAFAKLYLDSEFTLDFAPIHQSMFADCDEVIYRAKGKRTGVKLARVIPRGHSKSTIYARLLPLHAFLYKWSNLTVLLGNTQSAAERLLKNIRDAVENNLAIIEDFGDMRGETWQSGKIDNKSGGSIVAFGVGNGAIRGVSNPYRPQLIIADDLDDDALVRSSVELNNAREWWNKAVLGLGDNVTFTTSYIVVGTLIRKTSLLKHIIDSPDFDTIVEQGIKRFGNNSALWEEWSNTYKALAREGNQPKDASEDTFYQSHKDAMLDGTEVLWNRPDAYYYIMVYKLARGDKAFFSEIQNTPQDIATKFGAVHYVDVPIDLKEYDVIASLDPTSTGNKHSDLAAWVEVLYHRKQRNIIVRYVDAKQRNYNDTIKDITARVLSQQKRYAAFYCESNSMGIIIADALERSLRDRGYPAYINRIHNTIPKNDRINILSEYIASGQLSFARDINPELINEIEGNSQYDDALDALATIIMQLRDLGKLEYIYVPDEGMYR